LLKGVDEDKATSIQMSEMIVMETAEALVCVLLRQ
jgi:hypothetical protein